MKKTKFSLFVMTLCASVCTLAAQSTYHPTYHPTDKAALKAFFTQPSAVEGKMNWQQVMATEPDWDTDESWIEALKGLTWDESTPKRLTQFKFDKDSLSGNLDLSKCTHLTYLRSWHNPLTGLNLDGMPHLELLVVQGTRLHSLTVAGLRRLTYFNMDHNDMDSLTMADLPFLETFQCDSTRLSYLKFNGTGMRGLKKIHCSAGRLSVLELSDMQSLKEVVVESQRLKWLTCTRLPRLASLDCSDNQLTGLDLTGLPRLEYLICNNNYFPFSSMPLLASQPDSLYLYAPQNPVDGGSRDTTVNLTSQLRDGETIFQWYDALDTSVLLTDITETKDGIFSIPSAYDGDSLICLITNEGFPEFDSMPIVFRIKKIKGNLTAVEAAGSQSANRIIGGTGEVRIDAVAAAELRIYTPAGGLCERRHISEGTTVIPLRRGIYFIALKDKTSKVFVR